MRVAAILVSLALSVSALAGDRLQVREDAPAAIREYWKACWEETDAYVRRQQTAISQMEMDARQALRDRNKTKAAQIRQRMAEREQSLQEVEGTAVPIYASSELDSVGSIGVIGSVKCRVVEVVDKSNAVISRDDRILCVSGVNTGVLVKGKEVHPDALLPDAHSVWRVEGTKTYTGPQGSSEVPVIRPMSLAAFFAKPATQPAAKAAAR